MCRLGRPAATFPPDLRNTDHMDGEWILTSHPLLSIPVSTTTQLIGMLFNFSLLSSLGTLDTSGKPSRRFSWKVFKEHHQLLKNAVNSKRRPSDLQKRLSADDVHKTDSVDAAMHIMFSKTGEPEALSPTSDALRFHLMRVQVKNWFGSLCHTWSSCTGGHVMAATNLHIYEYCLFLFTSEMS